MAIKYYLGLDLGISSCGWAVMAENDFLQEGDKEKYWLDDFGVRIFSPVEDLQDGRTLSSIRRSFRSQRRLIKRRNNRVNEIIKLLDNEKVISKNEMQSFFNSLREKTGTLKITNLKEYDENKFLNPYVLRWQAQREKISLEKLAYLLKYFACHRGYLDKFSFDFSSDEDSTNKDAPNKKEKSQWESAFKNTDDILSGYETISDAVYNNKDCWKDGILAIRNTIIKKDKNESEVCYRFLFPRELITKEIEIILKKQQGFYPEITNDIIKKIIEIIFKQRDFEDGPGPKNENIREKWIATLTNQKNYTYNKYKTFLKLIGDCKYNPAEKVGFIDSVLFDFFHVANEISKLTVAWTDKAKGVDLSIIHSQVIEYIIKEYNVQIDPNTQKKKWPSLKQEICKFILPEINKVYEITISDLQKLNVYKNIEFKIDYIKLLKDLFGNDVLQSVDLLNLAEHWTTKLGICLSEHITPERRKKFVSEFLTSNNIDFDNYVLDQLLRYKKTGTARLSNTIMQTILEKFLNGEPVNKILPTLPIYQKNKNDTKNYQFLSPIRDADLINNQTTFRAINECRKVLKALFNRYHQFVNINLETGRELAKSFKERKKIEKSNTDNYVNNIRIAEELKKNNINDSEVNKLKYKLWEEQKGCCMYSGKEIPLSVFNSNNLEIDHIIPYSKLQDDSFNNKVLVYREYNQEKQQRTPLEWMNVCETPDFIKKFKSRATRLNLNEKKRSYLLVENFDQEKADEFISRNLNDTRYITSYILTWLQSELKRYADQHGINLVSKEKGGKFNILPINGSVTSYFRKNWLKNTGWGLEKPRNITNWHHAVDAIILASFKNKSYITFATDLIRIKKYYYLLKKDKITIEEYNTTLQDILVKWKNNLVYVPNAVARLQNANNDITSFYPTVYELDKIIEKRIPLKLKKVAILKTIEVPREKNSKEKVKKDVKIYVPEFLDVLTEDEYAKEVQGLKGNLMYPYISYKISRKIPKSLTSSQMPMKKKDLIKKDLTKEKNIRKDCHNNVWDYQSYYGFSLDEHLKAEFISNVEMFQKKENYKFTRIIVPNTIIWMYIKEINKVLPVVYTGKTNDNLVINIVGTEKSLRPYGRKNIFCSSINNFITEKLIYQEKQPDILGKIY